jgi:hypothetical protein
MTVFVIVWPVWQDIDYPLCSAYMCGMTNACDTLGDSIVTAIRSGPWSILGSNLTFSCGAFASYTNSGDSLLVFFWVSINPRLPPVHRGWCEGWKIFRQQEDTRKEKPTTKFKTTYQTWATQWFNMDRNDSNSHDQSLSLDNIFVCSSNANTIQGKYRDHCWQISTWAHAAIVTLYNETTRRDNNVL